MGGLKFWNKRWQFFLVLKLEGGGAGSMLGGCPGKGLGGGGTLGLIRPGAHWCLDAKGGKFLIPEVK